MDGTMMTRRKKGPIPVDDLLEDIRSLRRDLHAHPERSDEEKKTAERIVSFLSERGIEPVARGIGGHGLLFQVQGEKGGEAQDRRLLFRSDMDALPLKERSGASYASKKEGKHHACGHDGHMAMLTGALIALSEHADRWSGTVYGLFQPSEETGQGALRVLNEEAVARLDVDNAYGFHNIPDRPLGTMLVREGPMACASTGLVVRLKGSTSHAGEPHLGRNPIPTLAHLALTAQGLPAACVPFGRPALSTLIHLDAGAKAYGTSAGKGLIRVTLRAAYQEDLDTMKARLESEARALAVAGEFDCTIDEHEPFPVTENSPKAVSHARAAFDAAGIAHEDLNEPFPWSEDFGHITGRFGGALIGIGSGTDQASLHSPGYDFPDELLGPGMVAWTALAAHESGKKDDKGGG